MESGTVQAQNKPFECRVNLLGGPTPESTQSRQTDQFSPNEALLNTLIGYDMHKYSVSKIHSTNINVKRYFD